jgi:hypothetical protein
MWPPFDAEPSFEPVTIMGVADESWHGVKQLRVSMNSEIVQPGVSGFGDRRGVPF